jgi:hypothetical protein
MCHKPFENWILEQTQLNVEERRNLEMHLETCQQCKRLQSNWQAVHVKLSTARKASPAAGFAARWQETLQRRIEEQRMKQVLQVRRFFLFLGTASLTSLILLIVFAVLGGSMLNQLASTLNRINAAAEWVGNLQGYFFSLLHFTSPAVPLIIWVSITTVFSILALIWVVSLWRITFQGVNVK